MIRITSETERQEAVIRFVKEQISELEKCIMECDYSENVNGELVYEPGCYPEEKRQYQQEKRRWDILLDMLTGEAPFSVPEW